MFDFRKPRQTGMGCECMYQIVRQTRKCEPVFYAINLVEISKTQFCM